MSPRYGGKPIAALCGGVLAPLGGADDQGAAGGFDDVGGDRVELVDSHDAVDLGEESLEEAEVTAGDAGDGGDGLGVGEVGVSVRELSPAATFAVCPWVALTLRSREYADRGSVD
jgi:hypothetical protein